MTSTPPPPVPPPLPRPAGPGNPGLIIAAVVGGIVLIAAIAGVGVWFLLSGSDTGPEPDTRAEGGSASSSGPDDRPRVDDGAPATEVGIESIRMTAPSSGKDTEECEYRDVEAAEGQPENTDLKDVGRPEDGDQPAAGSQDMTLKTGLGELVVKVDNGKAPCTAASYTFLAEQEFFDDSNCHRLTTKELFVLQCGDPSGTGRGGPTYQYDNEYVPEDTARDLSESEVAAGEKPEPNYKAGAVAMANSGKDTNGSQFFIVYEDTYLPPAYTIFGELTSGLDIVREIADNGAVATG